MKWYEDVGWGAVAVAVFLAFPSESGRPTPTAYLLALGLLVAFLLRLWFLTGRGRLEAKPEDRLTMAERKLRG